MKIKALILIVITMMCVSSLAWSCGPMENYQHFGKVVSVDKAQGVFILQDAETSRHIEFAATDEILGQLLNTQNRVAIRYENKDGKLIATEVLN